MRLEELMKDPKFREIAEKVKKFAEKIRKESETWEADERGFMHKRKLCFRLVSKPDWEFKLWEEYKGYDVEKSYYKRYVCTANKYLGWLLKELSKKKDTIRYFSTIHRSSKSHD